MALVYLHGFNSSPRSHKASLLAERLRRLGRASALRVPDLSPEPPVAVARVDAVLEELKEQPVAFVGSSLGGFYAAWLAEKHHSRAVLLNPAMRPFELLAPYLGEQVNPYTGVRYVLRQADLDCLRSFRVEQLTAPQDLLLIVQTGDEVIDYRQTLASLPGVRRHVIEGGSHSFDDFAEVLDEIIDFCRDCL